MKTLCKFLSVCAFTLSSLLFLGCGNTSLEELVTEAGNVLENHVQTKVSIAPPPATETDSISIASFNIQVFGQSKINDAESIKVIVDICRRFDIMAIQEVRSSDQSLVPNFVQMLNAEGRQYDYLVGPRQGRTTSKEQYVFVFDKQKIEVTNVGFVVPDEADKLHRPPVASRFTVRSSGPKPGFSFVLANVHTDPDETATEIAALAKAFQFIQANMPGEDDVIMLGDFNEGESKYAELAQLPNMAWAISGTTTNTARTKAYDNLFFESDKTTEFLGTSGVFDFQKEYNLSDAQALKVSDHFPVWGMFSSQEAAPAVVAALPETTTIR